MTPSPREIDAMVAEKVMDCKVTRLANSLFYCGCGGVCNFPHADGDKDSQLSGEISHYSTDIAAAMEVVDKLGVEEIHLVSTKITHVNRHLGWYCCLMKGESISQATAETRELAICLAALKVKGITI